MRDVDIPAVEETWKQECSLPACHSTLVIPEQEGGRGGCSWLTQVATAALSRSRALWLRPDADCSSKDTRWHFCSI